jgi:hypothetical protein
VVQTFTYLTDTAIIDSSVVGTGGTSYSVTDGSTDPVLTALPFNSLLGTLESFTVDFALTYDGSHTNGPGGGGFSMGTSGDLTLAGITFSGTGGGNGTGGAPFDIVTVSYPNTFSQTFLVANAGVTYDPAILAAVTGGAPFEVRHEHNPTMSPTANASSFLMSIREGSTLSLTYTYDPIPEPGTAALGLLAAAFAAARRRRG